MSLHELSLFSGYGGFTLGLRLAGICVRTVCYVENDPYCQKIIRARIRDGYLNDAPIWPDVRTFDGRPFAGKVGIITAGFPCQPHSTAGKRLGARDSRNLWPDLARCIGVVRPSYILLENVPGLVGQPNPYCPVVIGDLAEIGYDAQWGLVPAAAIGAPHLRWRWWCLAYPAQFGPFEVSQPKGEHKTLGRGELSGRDGEDRPVADAGCVRGERRREAGNMVGAAGTREGEAPQWEWNGNASEYRSPDVPNCDKPGQPELSRLRAYAPTSGRNKPGANSWWDFEPPLDRVVNGTPNRVGQLRALGNGVVPGVVAEFLRILGFLGEGDADLLVIRRGRSNDCPVGSDC